MNYVIKMRPPTFLKLNWNFISTALLLALQLSFYLLLQLTSIYLSFHRFVKIFSSYLQLYIYLVFFLYISFSHLFDDNVVRLCGIPGCSAHCSGHGEFALYITLIGLQIYFQQVVCTAFLDVLPAAMLMDSLLSTID